MSRIKLPILVFTVFLMFDRLYSADLAIDGKFGRSTSANNGQTSGYYVWQLADHNHVIYSASSSGTSPAGTSPTNGLWNNGHRIRLRTYHTGQGFLFENSSETALFDIDASNGNLKTIGVLHSLSTGDNYFAGEVGIGTSTPRNELDVRGEIRIGGNGTEMGTIANTDSSILFFSRGANGSNLNYAHDAGRIYGGNSSFDNYGTGGGWGNQSLVLEAGNAWGGYSNSQLVLKGNGNIGIGTNTPSNKLDVVGTIRAEEIIVETGWSDYVFEDGYDLPSLEEVEAHIETNGHLPGIPSAEEVAEKGVSLGDSQRMLLEKVEELVLYTIELNKRLNEKDKQIETLRQSSLELLHRLDSKE